MLTRIGIAVCALSMIAPAVSLAQTPPPPGPRTYMPPVVQPYDRMNPQRMEDETFQRTLNEQVTSPARAARAERVAALINEGRCDDAVALARNENDRRLARRAATVCESLETADGAPQ